jgi:hypothetical protein
VLFTAAGRLDRVRGWICVVLHLVGMNAILPIIRRHNPALVEVRAKWGHNGHQAIRQDPSRSLDAPRIHSARLGRIGRSAIPLVLDPFGLVCVGATLFVLAIAVVAWSMAANPDRSTYSERMPAGRHVTYHVRALGAEPSAWSNPSCMG